jgi:hypothetical protein
MARKKASNPQSKPEAGFVSVIHLKGTPEYRDWLARISKSTHITPTTICRLALAHWAAQNGHPEPPEK